MEYLPRQPMSFLNRLIENNFVPDPVYQKRMHDFFRNKGKEEDTLYQYLTEKKD